MTLLEPKLLLSIKTTVKNDGHISKKIKKLIETGYEARFNLDITTMVKFTISDTAPAAKNLSKEFDTTLATDCTMHVLYLCILYGLGLCKSRRTKLVVNQDSGYLEKQHVIATSGGAFPERGALVKKFRKLNNYFNTTTRMGRLEELQKFYHYPVLKTFLDIEVRVASTVSLFRRSIVNFRAFEKYFSADNEDDDSTVFRAISTSDWELVIELEGILNVVARLASVEIQCEQLLSSETMVLLKCAYDNISASEFWCYDTSCPISSTTKKIHTQTSCEVVKQYLRRR
ncbi:hypothetical protein PHMEG_00011099 [Phytophthora megakarya]|uniref:Uncharacterized protein n=1 Tax=Phytophthora megakarya TaxID=4795 RepID=A0A225WCK9_9STRA|nr:hypothetical protein PHMEG_00011099 [Phytophthora megakarya]